MHHVLTRVPCLLMLLALAAMSAHATEQSGPAWYEVRSGDHLTRIANRFGTTIPALRRDNVLRTDVLQPGQRLEIRAPFRRTRASAITWRSPSARAGRVIADFGPYEKDRIIMPRTGVDLALPVGSPVLVPAHGVLRYLSFMEELGTLAILDHGAGRHTVLGPLDPDTVPWQPGQALLRGDVLGKTARPDTAGESPHLHLEMRIDGKAVRPDALLP